MELKGNVESTEFLARKVENSGNRTTFIGNVGGFAGEQELASCFHG